MRVGIAVLLAWLGFAVSALAEKSRARERGQTKYFEARWIYVFLDR